LEGNLSFCRGMISHEGGRGNRNTTQILSMILNSNFLFSTSLGVSSAIWLYAQEITKHQTIL
jgi:hypothetical protein